MNEVLEKSLTELSESIKTKLEELSKTVSIDTNTLWIAFKSSMKDLENAFKREYP